MRRFVSVFCFMAMTMSGASIATAQSLRGVSPQPAELPPSSFTGRQYVDSTGCVFIRAGSATQVRWIPRVSRDRQHICGAQPTLARRTTTVAAAPAPAPQPAVQATRVVTAPAPTRRVVVAPPVVRTAPVVAAARPTVAAPQVSRSGVPLVNLGGNCANRSALANQYTNTGPGVRCGGHSWHPSQEGRVISNGQGVARAVVPTVRPQATAPVVTTTRRIVQAPRSVTHGTREVIYEPVWNDGRLNPNRGILGQSTQVTRQVVTQPQAVTTRARTVASVGASHRYVQIGTFGQAANAQRSAARMQAQGLPVRIQAAGRYNVVLVGPFNSSNSLRNALSTARRSGFGDAFTR